jgi:hypothetical protein
LLLFLVDQYGYYWQWFMEIMSNKESEILCYFEFF